MPHARMTSEREGLRLLLTLDSIGGVWRYALDLAESLRGQALCMGLGFGPRPSAAQEAEARRSGLALDWRDLPLDWQDGGLAALSETRRAILACARALRADALHLDRLALAHPALAGYAMVTTAHSCLPTWWKAQRREGLPQSWRAHARANRQGLAASDLIVAPSAAHARLLRSAYGVTGAVRVIHNSARACEAPPARKEPFVFAAGRWWDEGKNAATLDAAAARVDWPLFAAGATHAPDGCGRAFAHARALGPLPAQDVRGWMRRASLFASPSLYEPFGLAALEAAHEGCALALADNPTYRELWDGCALFFDPRDPAAMANALTTLARDDALRARLSGRALARARVYSPQAQAGAILDAHRAAHALRLARGAGASLMAAV